MEILKWRIFPVASVLISLFFYLKNSSKFQTSNSACSLLPHDEFWILSNQIVTPQGVFSGAVEVKGGKIASVVEGIDKNSVTGYVIDYGDAVVMPGLIDVARKQATTSCFMASWQDIFGITSQGTYLLSRHVHLDEPGRTEWEGFSSGTKAAAAGGITTLIDMPLNSEPTTVSVDALKLKVKAAKEKIYVDVGFWGGLVPDNAFDASALDGLLKAGVLGLKSFMCPSGIDDFPMTNATHIKEGLYALAKYNRPLLVHAEIELNSDIYPKANYFSDDPRSYSTYLRTRPPSWEEAAIKELLEVTKHTRAGGSAEGSHLHIVHLSDAEASLSLIKEAKRLGDSITVETCSHYLAFSAEEISDGDTRFKCSPPIRDATNKEKLWDALMKGHIDLLSSDHSPTVPELKLFGEGNFLKAWGGISSLQYDLSVTWFYGKRYGITLNQLASWWSERPAKLAGQYFKGAIVSGNHADIVVWDPNTDFVLDTNHTAYSKHPSISAYMGTRLSGKVLATFVRGNLVYEEGKHARAACGTTILAN